MSRIPSNRGSSAGIKIFLKEFDNSAFPSAIGSSTHTSASHSIIPPTNVREFDEVVLNINCIDNFGNAPAWGGTFTGFSFAQSLEVQVLYSNMVDFMQPPPLPGNESQHWSPLLLEEIVMPFVGSVDVAKYSIVLKDLQIGASDPTGTGSPSQPNIERPINLRIPTTMAEWIAFIVSVDITGTDGFGVTKVACSPKVQFSLYRGVTL